MSKKLTFHCVSDRDLLIHKVSCDLGYKKNRVSAPKSFDLGASETRFHPNLLLHFILLYSAFC